MGKDRALITISPQLWNFIFAGIQTIFTRALLLQGRGATKGEIEAHIDAMEAENNRQNLELQRLREENA